MTKQPEAGSGFGLCCIGQGQKMQNPQLTKLRIFAKRRGKNEKEVI